MGRGWWVALIVAVAVLLTWCTLGAGDEADAAQVSRTECRYQGLEPGHWTDAEAVKTIECWTAKLRGPAGGVTIASRETGGSFYHRAYNADGCNGHGCLGVFQMHALYYPGWADKVRPWHERLVRHRVWWNLRWNALVAVAKARRDGGWGDWSTCC